MGEARKLKWKDPKPTDLNINRWKDRTRYCSRNMRRLMFRGEILDEVGNSWFTAKSLVLPYAAVALLGKGGASATLLLIFMAVTSASSAELIAVSSIWTYDIYQTYINPKANGKFLIRMSHVSCIVYAILLASFSTGLFYAGISMGYLYLMMGCIISSAVTPATLALMWKDQNWQAAAGAPVLGLACALIAWLVTAKKECGVLNVDCTGSNNPMLAGNVTALLSPLLFVPILTYGFGRQNYDWQSMKAIRRGDDSDIIRRASVSVEAVRELERAQ